jgi:DNA-binding GntR family transcriptional regulator
MEEALVHQIMTRVLASGIAMPGSKLGEQHLADLFCISRDRMRRVLQRLGYEGKLELVPNRGARTIDVGLTDARVVYDARRVLEGGIALTLAERITTSEIDALFAHQDAERDAIAQDDMERALQLGGALHMRLAELIDNKVLVETLRALVDRTSTLLLFFGPSDGPACSCREHRGIVEALSTRDPMRSREAMCSHLSQVETRLRTRPRCEAIDIETLVITEIRRSGAAAPAKNLPSAASQPQRRKGGASEHVV